MEVFHIREFAQYALSMIFAFMISFLLTPMIRKLAIKFGIMDIPSEERRIHKKPIAKLGGLAIAISFFTVVIINLILNYFDAVILMPDSTQVFAFLAGLALICIMGFLDDLYGLSPLIKFAFQFIAAGIVIASGVQINKAMLPFGNFGFSEALSIIFTLFWIVGITNAINFIDGLDGLAAGVSSISLIALFAVSMITGTKSALAVSLLIAILTGSILGFLPFNLNPAKIFMTDIGSNLLGFSLGVISIMGTLKSYTTFALVIPIVALAFPIFDVSFAILRRIKEKKRITEADRGHLHHRLLDVGLSQRQVVFILYFISALTGLCAISYILITQKEAVQSEAIYALILIITISILFILGVKFVNSLSNKKKKRD